MKKYLLYILLMVGILLLLTNIIIYYWNGWSFTVHGSTLFNNLVTPIATIISIGIYWITLRQLIKQNKINHSNNLKPYFERRISSIIRRLNDKQFVRIEQREEFNCFDIYPYLRQVEAKLKLDSEYHGDVYNFHSGNPRKTEYYRDKNYVKFHINFIEPLAISGISTYDQVQALIDEINNSGMIDIDISNFKKEIRFEMIAPYVTFIDDISMAENQYLIPMISKSDNQDHVRFEPLGQSKLRRQYDYFVNELYPERKGRAKL